MPVGAKARDHVVERLAQLAVLVGGGDLDGDVERALTHTISRSDQRGDRSRQEPCQQQGHDRGEQRQADAPGENAPGVFTERRHRLGHVDLRDDAPSQRVQVDRPVRHQGRNTTVAADCHQARFAPKRCPGGVVLHGDDQDRRAELFDGIDCAAREARPPQCREERRPVLDQEPGIVPHRMIRADQVDFTALPQALRLPLLIPR